MKPEGSIGIIPMGFEYLSGEQGRRLTQRNLHSLQKLYKVQRSQIDYASRLCDVRVRQLFIDSTVLVTRLAEEDMEEEMAPEGESDITREEGTSTNPSEHGESTDNIEYPSATDGSLRTMCNAVRSSMDSTTRPGDHGLSRIFDPGNKSLLLLNGTGPARDQHYLSSPVPLQEVDERALNKRPPADHTKTQKSRIPRPQSFRIPALRKGSQSKFDLRFPKFNV